MRKPCKPTAAGRVLDAVDDVLRAAEKLKRANIALSLEAKKTPAPELKVRRPEQGNDRAS